MYRKYWNLSAPISVHVEVTEACNERCRHCYNFSREEKHTREINWSELNDTIAQLKSNNIFHCIITGGEPLLAMDKTLHLAKEMAKAGISISLNSNLMIADERKMTALKEAGVPHVLTTLHSYKEDTHDYMSSTPGSFRKILKGIKETQRAGIRITVNTIFMDDNKDDIYDTAKFVYSIGVRKYLANRCVPSESNPESQKIIGREMVQRMVDDLVKARQFMETDTCRHLPECFTDQFPGRGCAAGKRHMLLNVDGLSHGCVHEQTDYGNIHEIGLKTAWQDMKKAWLSYVPEECRGCPRVTTCVGGCRMVALISTGKMNGVDPLRLGNAKLSPYEIKVRQENGFKVYRTVGAKVACIDD